VVVNALAAGSTSADVVTALTALVRLGVRPNDSCRAAAITIHGNGDSTGAVGALPANGFRTALTTVEIAVVTTSTGAGGCSFGFSAITSTVFGTDETITLAVGAGSSDTSGSSAVLVDSVASDCTVRAVAVPIFGVDSTASWVGLVDCCDTLDFFFFFGDGSAATGFGSLESVDSSAFSSCGCLPSDVTCRRPTPTNQSTTTQTRKHRRCRPTRLHVRQKRRPRFREPPPIHR
jgi:hypothetical protein